MKKIIFASMMLFGAMSANAQFTVYQPIEVPRTSYTPSPGYGTPFTIYEPVYGNLNRMLPVLESLLANTGGHRTKKKSSNLGIGLLNRAAL